MPLAASFGSGTTGSGFRLRPSSRSSSRSDARPTPRPRTSLASASACTSAGRSLTATVAGSGLRALGRVRGRRSSSGSRTCRRPVRGMTVADGTRVLVVEDDEHIAVALVDTLRDEGYDAQSAPNGRAGLALLDRWTPHVIILDLMMPVMDGRSFRAAQRQLSPALASLPVIVLSGSRDARARAEELEAVAAIAKPFDLDEVVRTVARVCQG